MLITKVQKGNIEQALKQIRRKFVKTQTMKNLRTKRYYKKPSEQKNEKNIRVKRKQQKENKIRKQQESLDDRR